MISVYLIYFLAKVPPASAGFYVQFSCNMFHHRKNKSCKYMDCMCIYNNFEKTPCLLRLGMNHAVAFRTNNHIKIHSAKSVFLIVSRKDIRILRNIYEKT